MRRLRSQARIELLLSLRQGERLLATFGIPLILLVFLTKVEVFSIDGARRVDFLVPGVLTLAVISSGLVGLGIATGFERSYGVLRRLGATPLSRRELVGAKTVSVLAVELGQMAVLLPVAALLGWRAFGRIPLTLPLVLLGTVAFSGLGLLMAGALRAEATLACANGLYVVLLFLGGIAVPLARLPGPLEALSRMLPAAALSDCLRAALSPASALPLGALVVLLAWTAAAPFAAALTFRWEES